MSIVVVVKKNGKTVIGADTAQSDEDLLIKADYVVNHTKLMRCGSTWLGLAGWTVAQNILESLYAREGETWRFGSRSEIFETARRMHESLKSDYFLHTQEDKDQPVESSQLSALIANERGIFELESYRSVTEYEKFWAIGSGKILGLGAMHAVYDRLSDPADIARAGIEAACEFDDGCELPMDIERVVEGSV